MPQTVSEFPPVLVNPTVVIANGGTASAEIDLQGTTLHGVYIPSSFTGTSITFTAAPSPGGTHAAVTDGNGNAITKTVAAGKFVPLNPADFAGVRWLKLASGSAEGGDRTIALAVRPVRKRLLSLLGRTTFTPASLTMLRATLLPALSRARGLLWQDASKTVPAVAADDPVRVAVCPFTAAEFTAPSDAARPLLKTDGAGKWWLQSDGVDDRMSASAGSWSGSGSAASRFRRVSGARFRPLVTDAAMNEWYRYDGVGYAQNFRTARYDSWVTASPPDASDHTFTQVSGTDYRLYVDGTQGGSTQAADWAAPTGLHVIGSAGGDDGVTAELRIYGVIVAAAAWDATTRVAVEAYLRGLSP